MRPCSPAPWFIALGALLVLALVGTPPVHAQTKTTGPVTQDLLDLAAAAAGGRLAADADDPMPVVDGHVAIDAAAEDGGALLRALEALGLKDGAVYEHAVSGWLPISAITALNDVSGLLFTRPAYAAASGVSTRARAAAPLVMVGSVTSQGDAAMRSDLARSTFGIDGTGVSVGTLSDSFDCSFTASSYADDIASGDLPAGITVLSDLDASICVDEGRAMIQIVADVAPGVAHGFHTAFAGQADFALGIEELAGCPPGSGAGCTAAPGFTADVVNDDVFYFAEPFFQDGVIAQAVDNVVANGTPYFVFAGNHARESYEAPFRNEGGLHDFDPGPGVDVTQRIVVPVGASFPFSFQWVDQYASVSGAPGAATDLDIYIADVTGSIFAGSAADNIGGDPVEVFFFTNDGSIDVDGTPGPDTEFDLLIANFTGPDPVLIKYIALVNGALSFFTPAEYDTNSSTIYGHMNSALGETIGAAPYFATPAFGVTPPVAESFSSVGPLPIYFATDGTSIGPDPEVRSNPNLVAPDGGNTTFFGFDIEPDGFNNFFGTSAAAPHAAGVGALMLAADPTLAPTDLFATLRSTAIDMDDPFTSGFDVGFDFKTGFGLIDALAAVESVVDGIPDCAVGSPLYISAFTTGAPGSVEVSNSSSGTPVDLGECSLAVFDGISELVTDAESAGVPLAPMTSYTYAPDAPGGPGAVILSAAMLEVDDGVGDAAGTVVAAVVYDGSGAVFGECGDGPTGAQGGALAPCDSEAGAASVVTAMAALFGGAVASEGGGAVDLAVAVAPNPSAGRSAVGYGLAEAGDATVALFDALGRRVAVLAEGPHAPGRHEAALDATALPAGVYVVRVTAGAEVRTARLTVVR